MTTSVKRTRIISTDRARAILRTRLKASGLTQTAFALDKLGDSPEALSLTLRGHRGLSQRMAKLLKLERVTAYRVR